ncbi:hypothetical protein B0T16DRAFT_116257 [Cercophora newfieldiana]|uniref:Uncharacterized protein n=1 Tax=Cercophora newfieldiana TaxID=92897 RepID=A0AA40CRA1_9PEZI|nr:hypothetical protein B0T16DRAFT_116257 [Cercophora newfieldiana]
MDGLRALGASSEFPLTFDGRGIESIAVQIRPKPNGEYESKRFTLNEAKLSSFFRDDDKPAPYSHSLKLASVAVRGPGHIFLNRETFESVFRALIIDSWAEHLIRSLPYGFHYSENAAEQSATTTYFLGTSFVWSVWTCRHDAQTKAFTTKCLIFNPAGSWHSRDHYDSGRGSRHLEEFLRTLEIFKPHSHSALCLPFVFAVNSFRWRERSILSVLGRIRVVESRTGHGSWGSGHFEEERDVIPQLTAEMGSAFNTVGNTLKHLNIIGTIFDYLEDLNKEMDSAKLARNDEVRASDSSIVSAVRILRRQCTSAREQCGYLEVRIRNQSSLFAFLTHEDSNINIEIANASKALAEATRRDGSSMKTIAVLTMAFLPATFFAALFSVPSLGWTDSDKFALYWACTIPVTLATFLLWAGLTQREWLGSVWRWKG